MSESNSVANFNDFNAKLDEYAQKGFQDFSNITKFLNEFLDLTKGSYKDWVERSIQFAGFNAVEMKKNIVKKATIDIIIICVSIGLVRGNHIKRIMNTMKDRNTKQRFENAIKILKIKAKVAGDYEVVTLSRMIACFPDFVARILHENDIPMAVELSELRAIHGEYPQASRHQCVAAIIPSCERQVLAMILDVLMVPYMMTSEIINSKTEGWMRKSTKSKISDSMSFILNAHNSRLLPAKERLDLCIKLGIMSGEGKISAIWQAVSVNAKNYLLDHYKSSSEEYIGSI